MKPNLGLFIGSEFHARSLTESKVFNLLVENYELKIFATSNICKYFEQIDLSFEIIEILNNKRKIEDLAKQQEMLRQRNVILRDMLKVKNSSKKALSYIKPIVKKIKDTR